MNKKFCGSWSLWKLESWWKAVSEHEEVVEGLQQQQALRLSFCLLLHCRWPRLLLLKWRYQDLRRLKPVLVLHRYQGGMMRGGLSLLTSRWTLMTTGLGCALVESGAKGVYTHTLVSEQFLAETEYQQEMWQSCYAHVIFARLKVHWEHVQCNHWSSVPTSVWVLERRG